MLTTRRFTIVELGLITVCCLLGTLALYSVFIPSLAINRVNSRKVSCLNNLKQLALVAQLYADSPTSNGLFPDEGSSACFSMNLLYDTYAKDYRLWDCRGQGSRTNASGMKPASEGLNLTKQMTDYGYDRGHKPDDESPMLFSDMGAAAGPGSVSTNHAGSANSDPGQNSVDWSGSGRFMDSTVLKRDKLPDDDIFQDNTKTTSLQKSQDSWIRND